MAKAKKVAMTRGNGTAKPGTNSAKILIYDIESSDLAADVGFMLCFGYKWLHEKNAKCIRIDEFPGYKKDTTNDKQLVKATREVFAEADMVVSWYGRNGTFDEPFIRTRLLYHELPPTPPVIAWDGQWMSRKFLRMRNNRLINIGRLLGKDLKTDFSGPIWMRAIAGSKPDLNYIVDHCTKDVLELEYAYLRMRPYMGTHPLNLNLFSVNEGEHCPYCGEDSLQKNGTRKMRTGLMQKYHCASCGGWPSGGKRIGPRVEVR